MSHTSSRQASIPQASIVPTAMNAAAVAASAARPKFNGPTKMRTVYIKTSLTNLHQMFFGEDFSGESQINIPPRLLQTGANISVKDRVLIIDGHRDQVREALFLIISKIYKLDRIRGGPCHVCILIPAAARQALIGPDALYHRLVCGFHGSTYSIKPDTQNLELTLKEDMTAAFYANINEKGVVARNSFDSMLNNSTPAAAAAASLLNGQKPSYQVSTASSLSSYVGKPALYEMLPVMLEGPGPVEVCATIMDLAELIGIFAFTRHQERMLKGSLTDARERADAMTDRCGDAEKTCNSLRAEVAELREALSVRQAATEDAAGRLQVAYQSLCCERDMWRAAVDQLDCRRRMELLRVGLRLQEFETEADGLRARCQALEQALSNNNISLPAHLPPLPQPVTKAAETNPITSASPQPIVGGYEVSSVPKPVVETFITPQQQESSRLSVNAASFVPSNFSWTPEYPVNKNNNDVPLTSVDSIMPPGLPNSSNMVVRSPIRRNSMPNSNNSLNSDAPSFNEEPLMSSFGAPPGFPLPANSSWRDQPTRDSINSILGEVSVGPAAASNVSSALNSAAAAKLAAVQATHPIQHTGESLTELLVGMATHSPQ